MKDSLPVLPAPCECNFIFRYPTRFTKPLPLNVWTTLSVSQKEIEPHKFEFKFLVNGATHTSVINTDARIFYDMKLMCSPFLNYGREPLCMVDKINHITHGKYDQHLASCKIAYPSVSRIIEKI